ncbi:MAG: FliM/FliN family flagellar motor switch protein, partial [Planctomycetes bacterium]|nr:FliM/FliN family flagellar motor switch protein [Planctomycetota bacterium]
MSDEVNIIQHLLRVAGNSPAGMTNADAADYDWTRPHRFGASRMEEVRSLADVAAQKLSQALAGELQMEVAIKAASTEEIYVSTLKKQGAGGEKLYYIGLNLSGAPCGYLSIAAPQAASWVARLLGGGMSSGEREMSALELSLLTDVMSSLAQAVCGAFTSQGSGNVSAAKSVSTELDNIVGPDSDEYWAIAFSEGEDAGKSSITVALASDLIEAGPGGGSTSQDNRTPEALRAALTEFIVLGNSQVTATVNIGSVTATVRDIAALEPGDVLVLDQHANDLV